jgi:Ribbon-helix-helix protein, copG family
VRPGEFTKLGLSFDEARFLVVLTYPRATMYIHRMVRTQLYLDESVHRRLQGLARQQGRTISELVRDALVRAYGAGGDEREASLRAIEGLWRNRTDIGDTKEYVKRLRRDTRRARPFRRP